MRQETIEVKSKGTIVSEVIIDLPESLEEAKADEVKNIAAMQYGLKVKAANTARAAAVGGPKSVPRMIANKLKDNPEAMAKVMKILGIEMEEG